MGPGHVGQAFQPAGSWGFPAPHAGLGDSKVAGTGRLEGLPYAADVIHQRYLGLDEAEAVRDLRRRERELEAVTGERRRTEIARSLALEPKFLLLDEPFAGIDPIAVHEIKSIVRRLSESGIGVLITDHNVRDTLDITHRAHIINLGNIVVSGNRDEVLASETARKIYLGEEFRM